MMEGGGVQQTGYRFAAGGAAGGSAAADKLDEE
jgi:hypothetical protein